MGLKVSVTDDILLLNDIEINLAHKISNYVVYEGVVIVMLDIPIKVKDNQNVLAFNNKGNQVWKIKNLFPNDDGCPYNMLKLDENDNVHLYNWCGFVVKVNPFTGDVIDRIFTR
jgi:hypothetical protein